MPSFLKPLLDGGAGAHRLINKGNGQVVATDLQAAFDSATRRTGLLKHESLPDGSALIIAPSNAIHTFFMRFDIDVAFVGKDGAIVKVCHALRPWRLAAAFRAFAVVELPAGSLARSRTGPGDVLIVERSNGASVSAASAG